MNKISFATLRLGKTSVEDIKKIASSSSGILDVPIKSDVICTQVPNELEEGTYVFIWLGSDNSKGAPTEWKQGFKAFGKVVKLKKGANYNDESTTTVEIIYIFPQSISRLDILREAPVAYYWCSAMPIIGLDDHSNQTIRMIDSVGERSDIRAFFNVINSVDNTFENNITYLIPELSNLFKYTIRNPKDYKALGASAKPYKELNRFADYVLKVLEEDDHYESFYEKLKSKEQWIWFEDEKVKAGIFRNSPLDGQTMKTPLKLKGEDVWVASGWDYDEKLTVPSFGVLQFIVDKYYGNKYKIEKIQNAEQKNVFVLRVLCKSTAGITKTSIKDERYLRALRTKPFMLLAGISGTGKSRIVREFAYKSCPSYLQCDSTTPGNYCMIEVKPNWHDSSELLGYYSNITKKFMFTKFIKFLVKAKLHPAVPFFVCLDEMNLAPVEQYFAEFLSVLETRRHTDDELDSIKTGTLVDKEYFKGHSDSEWYYTLNPKNSQLELTAEEELRQHELEKIVDAYSESNELATLGLSLPHNVFIIGTVNMDDTTHQFSRKVIDRAMTIEMNGGKLSQMFGHSSALEYTKDDKECWTMYGKMKIRYVSADDVISSHPMYADKIKVILPQRLDSINKCLANTPFVVSYRVLNELTIYLGVLLDEAGTPDDIMFDKLVDKAVDQIMLMKILPRIEGEEESFNLSNDETETINNNKITNKLEWLQSISPDVDYEDTSMVSSKTKIQEMLNRMESGFTRFWP